MLFESLLGLLGMGAGGYYFWNAKKIAAKGATRGGLMDRTYTRENIGAAGAGMFLIGLGWLIKGIV